MRFDFSRRLKRVRSLFSRRDEPVAPARDRRAESEAELDGAIEALLVDLHRLCGVDRVDRAAQRLETFLHLRGHALDERMHLRLQHFHDQRLMLQHSWHFMNRLLAAGKPARAWQLARESLEIDAAFRPGSADDLLALIRTAAPTDARIVERLLADCERAYPASPRLPEALLEHARYALALGDTAAALASLARIEAAFPRDAERDEFREFAARARRHGA